MATASNGTQQWILRIVAVVLAAGILGGVAIGYAQSGLVQRVQNNADELDRHEEAVALVPVITERMGNMKENMEREHTLILEAIKDLKR